VSSAIATIVVLLFFLVSYSQYSGARAMLALILVFVGRGLGRGGSLLHSTTFALVVLTVVSPLCFLLCGVQLTFAALLGILLALSDEEQCSTRKYVRVCSYAWLATSLVSLIWFGKLPIFGVLANMMLAPVIVLVGCKGGLFAIVLALSVDSAGIGLQCVAFLLSFLARFICWIAESEWLVLEPVGIWKLFVVGMMGLVLGLELKRSFFYYCQKRGVSLSSVA
jgi:predicted membrane metal-binding protein